MTNKLNLDPLIELTSQKKRVNSRRKGATFERELVTKLNKKFNSKEFSRTPGSGAFATTHKNLPPSLQIHGDLITPSNFKFCIEAKNGYNVNIYDLFKKRSELVNFITQAKRDAKNSKKQWLLIYKKTRKKALIVSDINQFPLASYIEIPHLRVSIYLLDEVLRLDNSYFTV